MDESELNKKSVKELRLLITERGLDGSGCVEKGDLVRLILTSPPTPKNATSSKSTVINFNKSRKSVSSGIQTEAGAIAGELLCTIVSNYTDEGTPSLVVVLNHGYGAGGDDLVPVASHVFQSLGKDKKVKFVFPSAPLSLAAQGMGLAWYPLDINRMVMRAMSGELQQMMAETPEGIEVARKKLTGLVEALSTFYSIPLSRIILGGFSQGATMALEVALHLDQPLGALVLWSPPAVHVELWAQLAQTKKGMKIQHSHGTKDPIVPFFMGQLIEDKILKPNCDPDFTSFAGGHQIAPNGMSKLLSLVKNF